MASVKDHYDSHLAPLYAWMSGGSAGPRARFTELLRSLQLVPSRPGATALDLGAGNGFQTIPLAQAGYLVTGVDLCEVLLAELARDAAAASPTLTIRSVLGDLREISRHCPQPPPEIIVCMGDTLTHLATETEVTQVLRDSANALAPAGHLLLSFRDYTVARKGTDRFIPVRSEADRIFTCFLDYGATHVDVHDLVHARDANGWRLAASSYRKIRLAPAWVAAQLSATGLAIVRHTEQNGLVTLVARRPAVS